MNYNNFNRHLTQLETNELRIRLTELTIQYGPKNTVTQLRKIRHYQSEQRDPIPQVGQTRATKETAPCGTIAGYRRHINAKEPTCNECREARRVYNKKWRAGEVGYSR